MGVLGFNADSPVHKALSELACTEASDLESMERHEIMDLDYIEKDEHGNFELKKVPNEDKERLFQVLLWHDREVSQLPGLAETASVWQSLTRESFEEFRHESRSTLSHRF
mmetsp:Transcript_12418/g.23198  ORF Transcript_12418/g.23198 Transcript_12418/m.23198 type:complete len:110 (+) Transcript_12418:1156-1485(+)